MRVLQINSVCGYGSTGRISADIARHLVARGEDSLIAYGRGSAPEDIRSLRIGSEIGVRMHGVLSRLSDRHGFYSRGATKRFIRSAQAYQPDVIHLHNLHGYYINVPLLFHWLKEYNRPVVWTLHDCWAFTGHCAYFSMAGCSCWKRQCMQCPQKNTYPRSVWMDASARNFTEKKRLFTSLLQVAIGVPSVWLKETVQDSFLSRYPVEVIYNGVDITRFSPIPSTFRERYRLEGKKIVLGVANIWDRRKGLDVLLSLSTTLGDDFCVVVTGQAEIPKGSSVLHIPQTSSIEELAHIYAAADVYVNPSVEETFGLTTLEALACGTPAVVSGFTAVPEVVDDTCGLVVDTLETDAWVHAIMSTLQNPPSSEACCMRAKLFDKNQQASQYHQLYRRLLHQEKG